MKIEVCPSDNHTELEVPENILKRFQVFCFEGKCKKQCESCEDVEGVFMEFVGEDLIPYALENIISHKEADFILDYVRDQIGNKCWTEDERCLTVGGKTFCITTWSTYNYDGYMYILISEDKGETK